MECAWKFRHGYCYFCSRASLVSSSTCTWKKKWKPTVMLRKKRELCNKVIVGDKGVLQCTEYVMKRFDVSFMMEICTIYVLLLCTLCLIYVLKYGVVVLEFFLKLYDSKFINILQCLLSVKCDWDVVAGFYFLMHEFYVGENAWSIHNEYRVQSFLWCYFQTITRKYVVLKLSLMDFISSLYHRQL